MKKTTVQLVQEAGKAGMDMREVSERLDAAVGIPDGLRKWREWIRKKLESRLALGH